MITHQLGAYVEKKKPCWLTAVLYGIWLKWAIDIGQTVALTSHRFVLTFYIKCATILDRNKRHFAQPNGENHACTYQALWFRNRIPELQHLHADCRHHRFLRLAGLDRSGGGGTRLDDGPDVRLGEQCWYRREPLCRHLVGVQHIRFEPVVSATQCAAVRMEFVRRFPPGRNAWGNPNDDGGILGWMWMMWCGPKQRPAATPWKTMWWFFILVVVLIYHKYMSIGSTWIRW